MTAAGTETGAGAKDAGRRATRQREAPRVARLGPGELGDDAELLVRCQRSDARSRARRLARRGARRAAAGRPLGILAAFLLVIAPFAGGALMEADSGERSTISAAADPLAVAAASGATAGAGPPHRPVRRPNRTIPGEASVAAAQRYAKGREGLVSFAVVGSDGRTGGVAEDRSYVSASVVKALLLAAELRRLDDGGLPLDDSTRGLLASMITWSDNEAADTIYARVGDAGLAAVAGRAGMERFSAGGHWSAAQITAADMASFFSRLGRSLPESTDGFAKGLLGSVVREQSWGIPQAAGADWEVRFKGGWRATERGQLVHQAAELRRGGERVALAVLTDAQPSRGYAIATVRGVAERLFSRRPE